MIFRRIAFLKVPLPIFLGVMSLILFFLMWKDKRLSRSHGHRIRERTLMLLAVFGGALGGTLGMQIFHHKTQKPKFKLNFLFLILHIIGIALLVKYYLL
jgi:uncharacterized membrane protein YsdA (DUF1294 family)